MSNFETWWLEQLREVLSEFRKYQLDNNEPYDFDLLGFMEWLSSEKKLDTLKFLKDEHPISADTEVKS